MSGFAELVRVHDIDIAQLQGQKSVGNCSPGAVLLGRGDKTIRVLARRAAAWRGGGRSQRSLSPIPGCPSTIMIPHQAAQLEYRRALEEDCSVQSAYRYILPEVLSS